MQYFVCTRLSDSSTPYMHDMSTKYYFKIQFLINFVSLNWLCSRKDDLVPEHCMHGITNALYDKSLGFVTTFAVELLSPKLQRFLAISVRFLSYQTVKYYE